ncbi:hypothetical protein BCR35DRAFT_306869 [Leucosporidium creatinivorum]|uniref:Nudix hydrolase domain-containing protein n=1 Tax=Leucosporidium creatinivorum TaxID=106004 RepID=A0A1Y2ES17_9BASI|nr:hypothetical protein BCR35DRAFT_306869 [Leucosporidium creatinivorum]
MAPPQASSIPGRLLKALQSINSSAPRLIASPTAVGSNANPGASRRASVAIIIRLRPEDSPPGGNAASPTSSAAASASTSPFAQALPLPGSPTVAAAAAATSEVSASDKAAYPPAQKDVKQQLERFFEQDWVKRPGTTAEILFIKRATRATDKWSGHVAYPGGRHEPDDEDSRYTAMRETWEEVGLDLAEDDYLSVGALDDREITTSLGKRLLMILSPHVFLYTSPETPVPELQESEVASAHWIPIDLLTAPAARYDSVSVDISTRLAPKNAFARAALKLLVGGMQFKCILLPNEPIATGALPSPQAVVPNAPLKLWGLTLGMTLDLLSSMSLPTDAAASKGSTKSGDLSTYPHAVAALPQDKGALFAPSMASIFPRFSYPDINALIWIFGFRYRRTLKQSPTDSARVNWAGMSIGSYYAAVRRALVVAVVLRALTALGGLGWLGWTLRKRLQSRRTARALAL